MITTEERFMPFRELMRKEGLPDVAIATFAHYYRHLAEGYDGFIRETDILPLESLPELESLPTHLAETGQRSLPHTVMIKLNGGLGTSMGLNGPKSLLTVKDDLTFLDIIATQALHEKVPLILMNSFATREESLKALERYPGLMRDIPLDFLQHRVPKVKRSDLSPARWPENPSLEWCPPGHGDIYTSLVTGGLLDLLLEKGYRFAFVSNSDNLGAVMNKIVLGYFVEHRLPFLMEVATRTEEDRKGGHLAMLPDGQLILREIAQCHPEDRALFQDIYRYKFFNTNSIWINLHELKKVLEEKDYVLGLPMIRNPKSIDPRDLSSTPVYQIETAMGTAISIFRGAQALHVPRSRFLPVKTTNDLLAVSSDAYLLTHDNRVVINPQREPGGPPMVIDLDPAYYRSIDDLQARFPYGPPSLIECERLTIRGDFRFGRNVALRCVVHLVNETADQVIFDDGSILDGSYSA
ncbi:MAG: UTP--glucose-1-phosphate uridylyltransferase [Candidatus Eremiobacteraeota bacterium]|nr:UTP--glucose-1-phosphate uridylyltransferase [Candidatus Eremiobacteraeota bacterium]